MTKDELDRKEAAAKLTLARSTGTKCGIACARLRDMAAAIRREQEQRWSK